MALIKDSQFPDIAKRRISIHRQGKLRQELSGLTQEEQTMSIEELREKFEQEPLELIKVQKRRFEKLGKFLKWRG